MVEMLDRGETLPVDFTDRFIYFFIGPVDPVRDEVVGPAGRTAAMRMHETGPRRWKAKIAGIPVVEVA